jgi:hypothetical protein
MSYIEDLLLNGRVGSFNNPCKEIRPLFERTVVADQKGATELGGSIEPERVNESYVQKLDERIRARLKRHHLGVEFLGLYVTYGMGLNPQMQPLFGFMAVFTARGVVLGDTNNITQPHIYQVYPTDAQIDESIEMARNSIIKRRGEILAEIKKQGDGLFKKPEQ